MSLKSSYLVQQLALFGVNLFELDVIAYGHPDYLGPDGFLQLSVCLVRSGFLSNRGVHDHAGKFL